MSSPNSPAKYDICLSNLNPQEVLPDGDCVIARVVYGRCPPHRVQLELELGKNVTWWKAIKLFPKSKAGEGQCLAEIQDTQFPVQCEIDKFVLKNSHLVLCKAKTFGVKKPMYAVSDAEFSIQGGNLYTLRWEQD